MPCGYRRLDNSSGSRFSLRILTGVLAISATAIVLIAIVIGGNTTVFSIPTGFSGNHYPGSRGRPRDCELGDFRRQRSVAQQPSCVSPFSRTQRNHPSVGRR